MVAADDSAETFDADKLMKLMNLQRLAVMGRWRGTYNSGMKEVRGRNKKDSSKMTKVNNEQCVCVTVIYWTDVIS